MNFNFPIKIVNDLSTMTHQFLQPAMEVYGAGMVSFFSDYTSTLAARSARGTPATYCAGTDQPLALYIHVHL
jgi:hypothetical protein